MIIIKHRMCIKQHSKGKNKWSSVDVDVNIVVAFIIVDNDIVLVIAVFYRATFFCYGTFYHTLICLMQVDHRSLNILGIITIRHVLKTLGSFLRAIGH